MMTLQCMTILQELDRTRRETLEYFALGDEALARTYAPGKWSVRYLLHHLSDAETVLFDRIRRTLSEGRTVLWAFDEAAWAKGLGYADRPLELSRQIYDSVRSGVLYYARLHYERDGHMEFVHSQTGVRTLKDEIDKVAWHNEHHLSQIRLALHP